ncbi:MAG: amidase, partial [Hyphomicrobiaceae bacterium]|nr:amidase [Hyphomicrobiaceae bacterium]
MSMDDLIARNDATGLSDLVRRGEVAPAELVEAAITQAEAVNPKINAIAERLYDCAREQAASVDRAAPFAGVPIAIKDLGVSLAGTPIHSGSAMPPRTAVSDSRIIEQYRAAGFIPVATSTTPEFGLRLVTESTRFGITRNPWNTERTCGGSSGGSAALVAAGVVPVAHASDGGGSIRVPSACCGLVGMKPSRGRVSLSPGAVETWYGFTVQHAVTRSVRDSARMLDLVSTRDPLASYGAPGPAGPFAHAAETPRKGMRIAVYRQSPLGLPVSADTWAALDAAAQLARDCGHTVEEIALPMIDRDFFARFAHMI